MTLNEATLLILFLFPLAYSPGPGNMFFAALGARYGLKASMPANLGYHLATFIASFAIGAGFTVVFNAQSIVFGILQKAGAVYIFWLAYKIYRSQTGPELVNAKPAGPFAGAILLLLNPKGYLIMALMFSQFQATTLGQTAVIAGIFTINNMVAFLAWTMAGQSLAQLFQSAKAARYLNTGFAICLAIVALWLMLAP